MNEISRVIAYLIGILAGVFALVIGIIRGDWELIALGVTLITVDGVAAAHTPSAVAARGRHGTHE